MSILSTLLIAASGMQTQQQGLQTTGHNISNATTPGYSRQRLETMAAFPLQQGRIILGQGVRVEEIRAVVDSLLEAQLVSLHGSLGFADAESQALANIQDLFPTDGQNGIGAALKAFFGALSDLSTNPAGSSERIHVIGMAAALGNILGQTRSGLVSAQTNLDNDLHGKVLRLNDLLSRIADLNREVASSEVRGNPANDLRDQRQILLQEVSRLTGTTIYESDEGEISVLAGNILLVRGDRAASVNESDLGPSGFRQIIYVAPDGISFEATSLFTRGAIGSVIALRDAELPAIINSIDLLAKTVVDGVNSQHVLGFDLNGLAGGDFFDPIGAVLGAAGHVKVTSPVRADPDLIAAAQEAGGVPGDNRNALALVDLEKLPFPALGDSNFNSYFLSVVGEVGGRIERSENARDFQSSLLTQAQIRRDATSGVNIDEEMTNLILFQRAFEAASLLVRKGDEMYEALLAMVR
ncbi:MAG: flagellar hook-associated protein FlgK [Deltaproteobacteria bacterium]|nr:flagellar hook-associated protein FlgK [Deltaproteobacteria bacterium]